MLFRSRNVRIWILAAASDTAESEEVVRLLKPVAVLVPEAVVVCAVLQSATASDQLF